MAAVTRLAALSTDCSAAQRSGALEWKSVKRSSPAHEIFILLTGLLLPWVFREGFTAAWLFVP